MNLDTIILFIFATTPSTKASSKVRTHVLQNMVQEDGLEVHGNLRARLTYRIIMQNLGKSSRNQIREEANGSTSRGQLLNLRRPIAEPLHPNYAINPARADLSERAGGCQRRIGVSRQVFQTRCSSWSPSGRATLRTH